MLSSFLLQNDCEDCDAMLPSCLKMKEIQMTISSDGEERRINRGVAISWPCCQPLIVILPFSCDGWNVTIAESLGGGNPCNFHSRVRDINLNNQEFTFEGEFSKSGIREFATFTFHKPFSCTCKIVVQFHCHSGTLLTWGEFYVDVITKNEGNFIRVTS